MTLGHATSITVDITKPMAIKCGSIDFNALTLMTGLNGTGKSLINKFTWIMDACANIYIANRGPENDLMAEGRIGVMQFYFDNTFVDNDTTGTIKYEYGEHNHIEATLEAGRVTKLGILLDDKLEASGHPVYMSSGMRLMTDLKQYMMAKKLIGLPKGVGEDEEKMTKLLEAYRLYDILYAEELLAFIDNSTTPEALTAINEVIGKCNDKWQPIKGLKLDYEKSDIKYQDKDDLWLSVATLGAGHQSLLNMLSFQEYKKLQ